MESRLRSRYFGLYDRSLKLCRPPSGEMSLALPRTVNEKYAWRKLFDRDPRYRVIMDKIEAKAWVSERVPDLAIPQLHWSGDDPNAIPEELLGGDRVLKPAHACAHILFLGKENLPPERLRETAASFLAYRHGLDHDEWGYFNLPSRLLIEEDLNPHGPLEDLKVYVYGGHAVRLVRMRDRWGDIAAQLYEADETGRLVLRPDLPASAAPRQFDAPRPATFDRAVDCALRLARGFDHMRVDLVSNGETLWFGEMTTYSMCGYASHFGNDPDYSAAHHWDLRQSWFLRTPQKRLRLEVYRRLLRHVLNRESRM